MHDDDCVVICVNFPTRLGNPARLDTSLVSWLSLSQNKSGNESRERERVKEENIFAKDETTDHLSCYPALPQLGHLY